LQLETYTIKIDAMKGRVQTLKILVWRTSFFALYQDFDDRRTYLKWVRSGMPIPAPEAVKHRTVKEYARLFGSRIFIETGTFRGMMVNAMKDLVDAVCSIETSFQELYEGQPLFSDIYELLTRRGFNYSGSWAELTNPLDGAHLQQDSIFIRK